MGEFNFYFSLIVLIAVTVYRVIVVLQETNSNNGVIEDDEVNELNTLSESSFNNNDDWFIIIKRCDEALQIEPNHPDLHYIRGKASAQLGEENLLYIEEAIHHLEQAKKIYKQENNLQLSKLAEDAIKLILEGNFKNIPKLPH